MYDPGTARWMSKDPLGTDGDSTNLYQYAGNRPTVLTDPSGLKPPQCGCPPAKRRSASQCCKDAYAAGLAVPSPGKPESAAGVICCDGRKVACVWHKAAKPGHGGTGNPTADRILNRCLLEHEKDHFDTIDCGTGQCGQLTRGSIPWWWFYDKEECHAYLIELACVKKSLGDCGGDTVCKAEVEWAIRQLEKITANCRPL